MMKRLSSLSWKGSSSSARDRPLHHANDSGTLFKNPWPSAEPVTWTELMQNKFPLSRYSTTLHAHDKAREVRLVTPDWGKACLEELGDDKHDAVVATWLGHAGMLVRVPTREPTPPDTSEDRQSAYLLFDPIFSNRAGPTQSTGPARMKQSPCQVGDLPNCHAVFISHSHYDHLDWSTITALLKRFPEAMYCVPLGIKTWLVSVGIRDDKIVEMDWWQEHNLPANLLGTIRFPHDTIFRIACVPAQHTSGRGLRDQNSTLWCGWVVELYLTEPDSTSNTKGLLNRADRQCAIYHAGDTGYRRISSSSVVCPAFAEIGARYGPLDLACLPIWRGGTLGFLSSLGLRLSHHDVPSTFHGTPRDAVAMHRDLRARTSLGMHFGTFVGAESESYEAVIEFAEHCEREGVAPLDELGEGGGKKGRAGVVDIGASLVVRVGRKA